MAISGLIVALHKWCGNCWRVTFPGLPGSADASRYILNLMYRSLVKKHVLSAGDERGFAI
ncbi:hypothetical protein DDR33_23980 [Pararcticibacter amylolyticus]|uniref:Uncharacterized protein n=1 Tax=Pararcticibacter amylolyticus TaxID=2173175 RepID=A0A2U2P9T5_9SPHI|nr:hypothetical protein DDR33_23980 [Pararcticibacter amylolyticus]